MRNGIRQLAAAWALGSLMAGQALASGGENFQPGAALQVGDPIDASSGAFLWSKPLFNMGGPLDFRLELDYTSQALVDWVRQPAGFPLYNGSFGSQSWQAWTLEPAPLGVSYLPGYNMVEFLLANGARASFTTNLAGDFDLLTKGFGPDSGAAVSYELKRAGSWFYLSDPGEQRLYAFDTVNYFVDLLRVRYISDRCGNRVDFDYAATNHINPAAMRDGFGRAVAFQYSPVSGYLTNLTDQAGRSWSFNYVTGVDAADNGNRDTLRGLTDPLGHTTTFQYEYHAEANQYARRVVCLAGITEPLGNQAFSNQFGVAISGSWYGWRVLRQTDARGFETTTSITNSGTSNYVCQVRYPDGSTEEYLHHSSHSLPQGLRDAAGRTVLFAKNTNEQLVAATDRTGATTTYGYDESRRLVAVTNADGGVLRQTWQTVTQCFTNPFNGHAVCFQYDHLVCADLPGGAVAIYQYDAHGHVTNYVDPEGNSWTTAYQANGLPLASRNPAGGVTTRAYDSRGLLHSETDSDGGLQTYGYDAMFRQTSITNADGTSLHFAYDRLDRMTQTVNEAGGKTGYRYDANGNLAQVVDALGQVSTRQYDALDQMTNETDAGGFATGYAYDSMGRLVRSTDPAGRTVVRSYNALGWLTNAALEGVPVAAAYDAEGRRTAARAPSGAQTEKLYDGMGRETSLVSALDQAWNLRRDAMGRLVAVTDPLGLVYSNRYNARGDLVAASRPLVGTRSNIYDAAGYAVKACDFTGAATGYGRTPLGRLVSVTNPLGHVTRAEYDARGRVVRTIRPDGGAEEFVYDGAGQVLVHRTPATNTTTYGYDALGRVVAVTNALGAVTRYTYTTLGQPLTIADPETGVISNVYDALRRRVQIAWPDGAVEQYTYNATNGLVETRRDPRGYSWHYAYDADERLLAETDPLGHAERYAYDAAGRLTSIVDRTSQSLALVYDANDRLTRTGTGGGLMVSNAYDAAGRLVRTDDGAAPWRYAYDANSRLTNSVSALGQATRFELDAIGRVTGQVNALLQRTSTAYDPADRPIAVTDPLGRTRQLAYDLDGRLVRVVEPDGATAAYAYDAPGNLVAIVDLSTQLWAFARSPRGRLRAATDPLGRRVGYAYDVRGRLAAVTNADGAVEVLLYDLNGNLTNRSFSTGLNLAFAYDPANRLVAGDGFALQYDPAGRVTNTIQNGYAFSAARDDFEGRLVRVACANNAVTIVYEYDASRTQLRRVSDTLSGASVDFAYDGAGRQVAAICGNGVASTNTYDAADRLVRVRHGTTVDLQYLLDAAGQPTQTVAQCPVAASSGLGPETLALTFDAAAQISTTGYAYDARGRLTRAPGSSLAWDTASRLVGIDTTRLDYNGLGDLVARVQGGKTNRFFRQHALPNRPIVSERDETTGAFVRHYVWTPDGRLLYMIDAVSHQSCYFHFDPLGNTLAMTDATGGLAAAYAYDPYGRLVARAGALDQPFTFAGQFGVRAESAATNLYQMGARYYSAAEQRFVSREPRWPDLQNPRRLNPYQYAANNPLLYVDPNGREPQAPGEVKLGDPFQFSQQFRKKLDGYKEHLRKKGAEVGWMSPENPRTWVDTLGDIIDYYNRFQIPGLGDIPKSPLDLASKIASGGELGHGLNEGAIIGDIQALIPVAEDLLLLAEYKNYWLYRDSSLDPVVQDLKVWLATARLFVNNYFDRYGGALSEENPDSTRSRTYEELIAERNATLSRQMRQNQPGPGAGRKTCTTGDLLGQLVHYELPGAQAMRADFENVGRMSRDDFIRKYGADNYQRMLWEKAQQEQMRDDYHYNLGREEFIHEYGEDNYNRVRAKEGPEHRYEFRPHNSR